MVSELLLNRGEAFGLFGEIELAGRWMTEAKTHSEEHGNHQIFFQAEAALQALRAGESPAEEVGAGTDFDATTLEDIEGVRIELSSMRDQLVSTGGESP